MYTALDKTNLLLGKLVKRVALLEKKGGKTTTSGKRSFTKKNVDVPLAVRVSTFAI